MSFATGVDGATYYSYLLRMWQVSTDGEHAWRIQLENVQTGDKHGFGSLDELLAYLSQLMSQDDNPSGEGR